MKRYILFGATIGVLVIVAVAMVRRAEVRTAQRFKDQIASLNDEITTVRREGDVKRGLMALQLAGPSLSPASAVKSDTPAIAAVSSAQVEPVAKKQRDPDNAEIVSQLDEKLYAEPQDASWSSRAAKQIMDLLTVGLEPGTLIRSAECRKTFCRIETSHRDLGGFRKFVDTSFAGHEIKPWNGAFASFVTDQSSGTLLAVSYLSRENENLPSPSPIDE
jgi:hypothetical protein